MPKKTEGGPLVSPGIVCYSGKNEKLFWFSSMGQMVQFDTIKGLRILKNYFGQVVGIEKKSHNSSRVSLHEAPTENSHQIHRITKKEDVTFMTRKKVFPRSPPYADITEHTYSCISDFEKFEVTSMPSGSYYASMPVRSNYDTA